MQIHITSNLTPTQTARLHRAAAKNVEYSTDDVTRTFVKASQPRTYEVIYLDVDNPKMVAHDQARAMMVVAGTTFEYEIID